MPRGFPMKDEVVHQLLQVIQENNFVYNTPDKYHSERVKDFWDQVALSFGVEGTDGNWWRSRWKNLRDTYIKHRKIVKGQQKVQGVNKTVKWKFYDHMAFLDPYMPKIINGREEPLDEEADDSEAFEDKKTDDEDDNGSTSPNNLIEWHEDTSLSVPHVIYPRHLPQNIFKRKKSLNDEEGCGDMRPTFTNPAKLNKLSSTKFQDRSSFNNSSKMSTLPLQEQYEADSTEAQDPDLLLFQSYALRLKKLPSDAQSLVKMQMSQIFFNVENPHFPPIPVLTLPVREGK